MEKVLFGLGWGKIPNWECIFVHRHQGARDSYHGKQRVSPFFHGSELCFQEQSDPINRERECHPINPATKEMISDSVELCETEVCFLHIQLIGTNV